MKDHNVTSVYDIEQDGTGISRRHIQGSKIAKKLQSVKYSFTEPEKPLKLKRIGGLKRGPFWIT